MNINEIGEIVSDLTPRPKIAREGWLRTAAFLTTGGIVTTVGQQLKKGSGAGKTIGRLLDVGGRTIVGLGFFSLLSYRDPERGAFGSDPDYVYAPTDGKVIEVNRNTEETKFIKGPAYKITIANHLLNVHVQRAPLAGLVRYVFCETEASKREANYLGIVAEQDERERRVLIVQEFNPTNPFRLPQPLGEKAPGSVEVWAGNRVEIAQKIGVAGFGQPTLVSIYLPADFVIDLLCKEGQRVQAGMTVLARFRTI
jgi:phosphatidylserine decarboxylase